MNPTGFADQVASVSLPPGWAWARLADIARVNPALDIRITDDAREVTFVPMAAVDEGFGGVQRPQVRAFGQVKKGYTPFQVNDVIMAKITPCMENGKGGVVRGRDDEVFLGSTEFHVLRARAGVLPEWIGSFLAQERVRRAARLGMKGSAGQLRVPEEFLERLYLPLPPTAEQQRIAERIDELFTDLAAGVSALERVKRNLSRYRAAVLHAAVTGRLTEAWRKQHPPAPPGVGGGGGEPGPKLLERILAERRSRWEQRTLEKYERDGKQAPKNWRNRYPEPSLPKPPADGSPFPELPKGWCWASVDQLVVEGLCNGISVKGTDAPPGVAALKLNAMSDRGFDYSAIRYIPIDDETAEDNEVHEGDFFVSRGNGSLRLLARGTVAQAPPGRVVFPDTMIRLRLCNEAVLLPSIWPSRLVRAQIERMAKTTAGIYKVSQGDLAALAIPLPPLAEQSAIVEAVNEKLSQIDGLEAEVERGLARAGRLRQSILKAAFEGKLVPQDPADEPARVLLERIRSAGAAVDNARAPKRGRFGAVAVAGSTPRPNRARRAMKS